MITIISLVNICHHTWLQNFVFLWWKLLRYTLSNFQICKIMSLTIVPVLYITSHNLFLLFYVTQSLYLWTPFTPVVHCSTPNRMLRLLWRKSHSIVNCEELIQRASHKRGDTSTWWLSGLHSVLHWGLEKQHWISRYSPCPSRASDLIVQVTSNPWSKPWQASWKVHHTEEHT